MKDVYFKLRNNLGLTMILLIGLGVEFSNFQSMFFRFMLKYRPDWGAVNHIPAMFLSAFLLLCIVIFGLRKQSGLSWFLALLTCVISFAVYSRMGLTWRWEAMNEVHFVILILSGMLPLLVAYTTHQIAGDNDDEDDDRHDQAEMERLLREIRKMQQNSGRGSDEKKKDSQLAITAVAEAAEPIVLPDPATEPEKIKVKETAGHVITCEHCGNQSVKKNKRAKYCGDECRMAAVRKRKKSDFYAAKDEYESAGVIEWLNPELA